MRDGSSSLSFLVTGESGILRTTRLKMLSAMAPTEHAFDNSAKNKVGSIVEEEKKSSLTHCSPSKRLGLLHGLDKGVALKLIWACKPIEMLR